MNEPSAIQAAQASLSQGSGRARHRSAIWTALLIPFVFLPYRWLWLPCALAATILVVPSRHSRHEVVRRHGTLVLGSVAVLVLQTALDPAWWVPWFAVMRAREHLAEPLTLDGIHLSPSGAVKVAAWLEPYVKQALR